jgi:hypothetical protein
MHRYGTSIGVAATVALLLAPATAGAVAHTPSISGNGWIAMGLLIAFIGLIVMVVFGALHLEKRDARLGRRRDDGYMFPFPAGGDDDDDFHHHGGGHHGHF